LVANYKTRQQTPVLSFVFILVQKEINLLENRMKALRFYGKEDMRLVDVVVPEPTSGEVQIRVHFHE
jgi:hypothetical protein